MNRARGSRSPIVAAAVALVVCLLPGAAGAAPCADADGDGFCDAEDVCPAVPDADQADQDGDGVGDACDPCLADPANDDDGDGVCGNLDLCPGTTIPEAVPTRRLNPNHWALGDGDGVFDTTGSPNRRPYTIEDTGGCSCDQIITALGLGGGHRKHGCSNGVMEEWTAHVTATACAPTCGGRTCGFDGCNGLCGTCAAGETCAAGQCVPVCRPACDGRACGPDGCGGDCGTCADGSSCAEGQCVPDDPCAAGPDCEDGNPCTADRCEPGVGCVHPPAADGAVCDDGNRCTSDDHCVAGRCLGGVVPQCEDGDPCTQPACTPEDGWIRIPGPDGTPCDDGDPCSGVSVCQAGLCVGAAPVDCDDANPCTIDSCDPALGCVHVPSDGTTGRAQDFVVAVDTSPSMDEELNHVVAGLTETSEYITSQGLPVRVFVIADPFRFPFGALPPEIQPIAVPSLGDPLEDLLATDAVWRSLLTAGAHTNFVAISDEDTTVPPPAFITAMDGVPTVSPDWRFHAVANPGACDGMADPTPLLNDLAALRDGILTPVCQPDWHLAFLPLADESRGTPCAPPCATHADCVDADPCTVDLCSAGQCVHELDPGCGGGSCCEPGPAPGCPDPAVTDCVCEIARECCDLEWFPHCADLAQTVCGLPCGGGGCADDLACEDGDPCTADFCVGGACLHEPNPGCGGGSCCAEHPAPGCDQPDVASCVCTIEPGCCAFAWMPHCVDIAQVECGLPCSPTCLPGDPCDDGNACTLDFCDGVQCRHDALPGCGVGSCCAPHPEPGCELPDVTACVCGALPHCCDLEWGPECVDFARAGCGLPCAGQCTNDAECQDGDPCTIDTCTPFAFCQHAVAPECLPPGSCCEPNPARGCDQPAVQDCVCGIEPSCCDFQWHPICADLARFECGAVCDGGSEDRDGDGFPADIDCDDLNPGVFPGAPERCNNGDDDCNGLVDEAPTDCPDGTACVDGDCLGGCTPLTCAQLGAICGEHADGCGGVLSCGECPAGTACDGQVCVPGECVVGMVRGCGVGACQGLESCRADGTWSSCDGPAPVAESCNGLDDDCDGMADETCAGGAGVCSPLGVCLISGCVGDADCPAGELCVGGVCQPDAALDLDGDGFAPPADCNDADHRVWPGAPEDCDGQDNDCDGAIDEGCAP